MSLRLNRIMSLANARWEC